MLPRPFVGPPRRDTRTPLRGATLQRFSKRAASNYLDGSTRWCVPEGTPAHCLRFAHPAEADRRLEAGPELSTHSGNRQEAREQRLYLEGLAFRVTFLRVLGLILGLLVFGQVFHRFCHVLLIFCSIFARDSWMDCFEAHHGLKRAKISQKSSPDPPKSSPGASKIEFGALQNAIF